MSQRTVTSDLVIKITGLGHLDTSRKKMLIYTKLNYKVRSILFIPSISSTGAECSEAEVTLPDSS